MSKIEQISVIGGGTMGNGIAQVFGANGFNVKLVETSKELAEKAVATIDKNLSRMVKKEKIGETEKNDALKRIETATDIADGVKYADLVIEAIPENFDLKKKVFATVDEYAPDDVILASNTSSISITKLAECTTRPERFIGMHFFNPVPVMTLVEVINGLKTDESVTTQILDLSEKLGKSAVPANDSPGFVSNRVLMPMINEAIFCVYEGVAKPENIDSIMKLGMAHPMGPLRLADFIGLDVCLDILKVLYDGFKDPKYRPCPLLIQMVDAGKLGDKTGEGFFSY
uniref:3-hydroxyacyl-CoA dehydrogenase family protein n=1 Tax=Rhodohalobacter sp. 8-1 TaxID=3131972 RepID=UPI0030EB31F0